MSAQSFTVEAVFENGAFRPVQPLSLTPGQRVTLTIRLTAPSREWPADVATIYQELAEDDRRLAEAMRPGMKETWPGVEGEP